jgi:hypothetical protein
MIDAGDITPLAAEAFFDAIRASTLEAGFHPTTLMVVGSADRSLAVHTFGDWPARTEADNRQLVYQAGVDLAWKGELGTLLRVAFITEATVSGMGLAPEAAGSPTAHPTPQDVLLVSLRTLAPWDEVTAIFRMVRRRDQTLMDLQRLSLPPDGLVLSPWLDTFIAGFAAGSTPKGGQPS